MLSLPTKVNKPCRIFIAPWQRGTEVVMSVVLMLLDPFQVLFEDSNVVRVFKLHQENGD